MKTFDYHKPNSVSEAVALMSNEKDSRPIAGGLSLLPTMKQRLAAPEVLIDLSGIVALKGIEAGAGAITVGAMTRHVDVANSPAVANSIPALAQLAGGIGDPAVRNRGTIGGSLANNDPAADYPAAALALGATIKTDRRSINADDFFQGMFTTALEQGELITSVEFPAPEKGAYEKFRNPASRYAIVGVYVAKTAGGVRVAVTGASQGGVYRHTAMEQALSANFSPDAIANIVTPSDGLNGDIHASAEYRAHLVGVMAKRAVARAY